MLERESFEHAGAGNLPRWRDVWDGARPSAREGPQLEEPGTWEHGWQYYASSARDTYYREHHVLPALSRTDCATLRSGAGPRAAAWLWAVPTTPATTLAPALFQVALRRLLRLTLPLCARHYEGCRGRLDSYGDHRMACAITGRLRRRAGPMERAWSTVFAEDGAVVLDQVLPRDTNLPVDPDDSRQIDLVAWGLVGFGRPVCADATIVAPLHRDGTPWVDAPVVDGPSFGRAIHDKETTSPELAGPTRTATSRFWRAKRAAGGITRLATS